MTQAPPIQLLSPKEREGMTQFIVTYRLDGETYYTIVNGWNYADCRRSLPRICTAQVNAAPLFTLNGRIAAETLHIWSCTYDHKGDERELRIMAHTAGEVFKHLSALAFGTIDGHIKKVASFTLPSWLPNWIIPPISRAIGLGYRIKLRLTGED